MATQQILHFNGTESVSYYGLMRNAEFAARFPGVKGIRVDSFSKLVGRDASGAICPITRRIEFKANPKLHKCGPRCQNATGRVCECSCRGRFHGAGGQFVCAEAA